MWISAGDHELSENIVHLVLAKIPGGTGRGEGHLAVHRAQGPREPTGRWGAQRRRAGRASTTRWATAARPTRCSTSARAVPPGGAAGAVGYLVGEPHRGLAYMFHMMNEARIGVGLGATALGYTGYLKSLDYARDAAAGPAGRRRRTRPRRRCRSSSTPTCGGCCWRRSPTSRARSRWSSTAPGCSTRSAPPTTERSAAQAHLLLDMLTPIAKSWPSQWCLEANSLAIQVHGGYGYTREYDVEQLYRDNRLNPIHEGTHGIQALDLLGRKVVIGGRRRAARCSPRRSGRRSPRRDAARRAGRLGASCRPRVDRGRRGDADRCGAPATRSWRWPTRRSTSRPSGTSSSPGSGWSRRWPPTAADGRRSTRASGRGARTSSATSCRAPARSSTCSLPATARPWRRTPPSSDRPKTTQDPRRTHAGSAAAPCRAFPATRIFITRNDACRNRVPEVSCAVRLRASDQTPMESHRRETTATKRRHFILKTWGSSYVPPLPPHALNA